MLGRIVKALILVVSVCVAYVASLACIVAGDADQWDSELHLTSQQINKNEMYEYEVGAASGGIYLTVSYKNFKIPYKTQVLIRPEPNWALAGFNYKYFNSSFRENMVFVPDWFFIIGGLLTTIVVLRASQPWAQRISGWPWHVWCLPALLFSACALAAQLVGAVDWVVFFLVMAIVAMVFVSAFQFALRFAFKLERRRGFIVVGKPLSAIDDAKPKSGA
jgi:hypothetical protein